jgi:hypothetical protein
MREAIAIALGLVLLAGGAVFRGADAGSVPSGTGVVTVQSYQNADGVTGYLALPADPGNATVLVVVGHGYGHSAADWQNHLFEMAEHGAIAVAVDYGNWQVRYGSFAILSAAHDLRASYPNLRTTVLFSVSMGAATGGYALATAQPGTFAYWFDAEGATSMDETYVEANAVASQATIAEQTVSEIEIECGGTHPANAICLAEESTLPHAADIAAEGLQGAAIVHDVNDGLVPIDQGLEMHAALRAVGVPSTFTTVLRGNDSDLGTTATGYAGEPDVLDLAGHSDESSNTQMVIRTSLNLLDEYLDGLLVPGQSAPVVADSGLGTLP